jgi:hypothetical protein
MFQSIVKNGRLWRFLLVMALLPGLFAGQFGIPCSTVSAGS